MTHSDLIDLSTPKEQLGEMLQKVDQAGPDAADKFFNNFKSTWYLFTAVDGSFLNSHALSVGMSLMNNALAANSEAYERIAKGTGYYWLGMAAYRLHDYETATFFFDAAVSEDIRHGSDPDVNPSPSFRFILLQAAIQEQAARQEVTDAVVKIERLIARYERVTDVSPVKANISLDHIRDRFLRPALSKDRENWRTLATALISFPVEWDFRNTLLDIGPRMGTLEPFFMHLFKGCVLFESLLRLNPTNPPRSNQMTLGPLLNHLCSDLKLRKAPDIGKVELSSVIDSLQTEEDTIYSAIKITGQLRNSIGHNIGSVARFHKIQYQQLFEKVGIACLQALATLY